MVSLWSAMVKSRGTTESGGIAGSTGSSATRGDPAGANRGPSASAWTASAHPINLSGRA